jgi:MinD-like ATPase involved in chromosome partitioning or flagellar assembly/CheY-like chemotaxis protein
MDLSKILIVDPDAASRQFLAQMLHKKNYGVFQAATGIEGVRHAEDITPDLIIFDSNLPDMRALEFVQHIHDNQHLAATPCVVLSSKSDPDEMRACLEGGCAEYYVKSGMVMITLVDAIPRLLLEGRKVSQEKHKGLLFVFLSAKGGTGTTSLCANIAMSLVKHFTPSTAAVVDMVLPFGNVAQLVGCPDLPLNLVSVSEMTPKDYTHDYFRQNLLTPANWLFRLLPGSPDPDAAHRLKIANIPPLIEALRSEFDYVILDVGRGLSRVTLPIIQEADLLCMILSTDQSTVTLTKRFWSYLASNGCSASHTFPILNRAVGLEGVTKAEAEKILGLEIKLTMPYMMGNFTLANNQNMPVLLKFPNDTASLMLKQAAMEMSKHAIGQRK